MRQNKRRSRDVSLPRLLMGTIAAGLIGFLTAPVQAQEAFDNQAIQFSQDTIVEFEFIESHGSLQAALGVRNETTGEETVLFREVKPYDAFNTGAPQPSSPGQDNTNTPIDFVGTVRGGTVQNRLNEFTFRANNRYVFFLESVDPNTGRARREVVSTQRLARFMGSLGGGNQGNITGSRVGWEDGGEPDEGNDQDFDDFVVEAGGYLIDFSCPPVR